MDKTFEEQLRESNPDAIICSIDEPPSGSTFGPGPFQGPQNYVPSEGVKNDSGKSPMSLIPADITRELADLYGVGARKYSPHNWRKGMKWSRVLDALQRHLNSWEQGEIYDEEDGQRHLISVMWCAIALAWYEKHDVGEDDRFIL